MRFDFVCICIKSICWIEIEMLIVGNGGGK